MLGIEIQVADIAHSLGRMGHLVQHGTGELIVIPPPYRMDVLHPIDLVEDVAIAYGYPNFTEDLPHTVTFGALHPSTHLEEAFRQVMTGLGFLEVTTLSLTSPEVQFAALRRPEEEAVIVENPITTEHSILRTSLLPSLLSILSRNRHRPYPQNIFEVGYVADPERQRIHGAAVSADPRAGFTRVKSLAEAVVRDLGHTMEIQEAEDGAFIPGRQALIIVGGMEVGIFGEVHPEVLERFEIGQPAVALELDLESINEA
jgi:phenylalanyl-tRNA synthetase beta chain